MNIHEAMAAIKMVLDAAGDNEDTTDKEICDAIDWDELVRLEKEYDKLKGAKND